MGQVKTLLQLRVSCKQQSSGNNVYVNVKLAILWPSIRVCVKEREGVASKCAVFTWEEKESEIFGWSWSSISKIFSMAQATLILYMKSHSTLSSLCLCFLYTAVLSRHWETESCTISTGTTAVRSRRSVTASWSWRAASTSVTRISGTGETRQARLQWCEYLSVQGQHQGHTQAGWGGGEVHYPEAVPVLSLMYLYCHWCTCTVTDVPVLSLMYLYCHWCTCTVTDVPVLSLMYLYCHWCTCTVTDVPVLSLMYLYCHWCTCTVTDVPVLSLMYLYCHWCTCTVTDVPVLSLMYLYCHWCTCTVTDVPVLSLMYLYCHWCTWSNY